MDCLAQRKKFKNKHPVWSDPNDPEPAEEDNKETPEDVSPEIKDDGSELSSDDDDCDMYANDVRSKKLNLENKELQYKHLANLNNERSHQGQVQQVQFHPRSKVALVTLKTGQADLFEVDGEKNRYIQNIKLPRTRATPYCSFAPEDDSIVISSADYRGVFYTYDMLSASIRSYSLKVGTDSLSMTDFTIFGDHMACRSEGSREVVVLSSKTYEILFSIKLNEPAKAIQFTKNNEMFIAGTDARVYVWDLRKTSLCKHRFQDEGSVHATSLAISANSNQLSIGSDSGIVNSYELDKCLEQKFPVPARTFRNLKTSVDLMTYNHPGELLLIGSTEESGAFRMIHSHSGLVYKNFPKTGKRYNRLLSANFSPLSGYLALGCSSGRAHLCRIPYYKSY